MSNEYLIKEQTLTNIADSIRNKTRSNDLIITEAMNEAIDDIVTLAEGTADATAVASNLLSGKTAYVNGNKITGSMTNNGAVSKSITPSTSAQSYTIPAGYHNGSGKVSVAAAPTSLINGDAVAADVLSGKKFFSDSYTVKTGTMTNNGAVSPTALNAGGSYTIPAGYHNGSGKVTANSLSSQTPGTATAAQILSGYTAWVNGSKLTGTASTGLTYIYSTYEMQPLCYGSNVTFFNGAGDYVCFASGIDFTGRWSTSIAQTVIIFYYYNGSGTITFKSGRIIQITGNGCSNQEITYNPITFSNISGNKCSYSWDLGVNYEDGYSTIHNYKIG